MVAAGEKSTPTATLKLLSQHSAAPQEKTAQNQELLQRRLPPVVHGPPFCLCLQVVVSEGRQQLLTHHGLRHQQHVPCDSPVRFLMFWEAAGSFISLHSDQTVRLHKANGHRQTLSACLPFAGLTATEIPGCLVGWGPGPVFTLLDSQLRPLDTADSALDIQLCEAAEHSKELVSAGAGNVCVWSVMLMRRRVTVREGLRQYGAFSHMALAAPRPAKPQRGFFASGQNVVVVDLDGGRVLERKERLCPRNITAMVYCSQLDCLIISSEDLAITVWDSDWKLHVVFLGHTAVVTSLFYCSELNILVSSSADCTIRIWNVEGCDTIDCIKTEQKRPPLYIRATKKGDTFLTVSHKGIDFWAFRNLYTLHCQLGREEATLRQIVVPQLPASYPTRVLCISGDRNISLLAEETGAVLTFYQAKQKILCADYLLQKEILLALTEAGTVLQANTLSNPITLMQEWTGVGQGPWQPTDHVTKKDAKKLPVPGPASCLVLYSSVADTQRALEEWRSLQGERGSSHRKYIELNNTKNKFLIIIGQSRGCVSVLKSDNGTVLFRIPAHSGQRVTTMQAYPEEHCLLSSGEDLTVVLWRVYPHIKECLTQQLSVPCDQPQICFAALGSQMALSFQEPSSGSYRLRTLQLQAVPQCLAYSCSGGQLYLGIGGDLFKMRCAKFLPTNYREMKRKVQKTPVAEVPPPVEKVIPKEPVIVKKPARFRKTEEPVPEIVQVIEQPKPRTPTPAPPPPRAPTPPPPPSPPLPREPSPEVPTFLKQFAEREWFTELYPDKKAIPDSLTPDDFCLKLLSYLQTCCVRFRMEIMSAFHALHQQGLLLSTDRLYTGLSNSLQKFAKPNMSPLECGALTQMLNLLKNLKSKISFKLMKTLLALLACEELELRKAALRLLRAAGVDEAEDWLQPELESWQPELQDPSNAWANLHGKADFWLEMWITEFKKHNQHLNIETTDMGESPAFSLVDVLNYFCSVQREEHRKATRLTAYHTVTLPLKDCAFKPILRLGETYSMDRIRRPLGQ
ncbi:unnamed protein product [Menidia menidia]|uniref:(Atlantic silverside) hypothetical protein n=1 Tax=Menidia menidia TaxID=238744 RepID=A0A8S4AWP1_9TELE|nr:unnamed protein product [Menidia menidia]